MEKDVIKKCVLSQVDEISDNLKYWLSRPASERLEAVDYLRRQLYGDSIRLQRTLRVVKRSSMKTEPNKNSAW